MSVIAAFHTPTARERVRTALADLVRRLAAGPLDSPVLSAVAAQPPACPPVRTRARRHTVAAQPPACPPVRTRAHWHTVVAADGTARLEATWYPDH